MNPIATFLSGTAILMLLLFYVGTTYQTTKRFVGTLLILGATLFAILSMKLDGMKLGIDLQGGSEFVVQLQKGTDSEGKEKPVLAESVQQAIAILEKRLNPGAEKDLLLQPQGEDKVLIQMPGVTQEEIAGVRNKIEQVAKLEFRLVHPQNSAELARTANGGVVVGYVKMKVKDPKGEGGEEVMLVKNRADMDGKSVTQAFATLDGSKGWMIILKFDGEGAKLFGELTAANVNKRLAVVVDGEVISAPNLNEAIYGGSAEISGSFTETSARSLASALENPLENPMIILSESTVTAAYGQSSIDQGKWIGIAGLLITTCFMLFIYRAVGIVAIIGLVVNLTILAGAMSLFQFTLTMPGIAGLVLTIGMAVDANVLIYERLREEMEAGRSFASALNAAYDKAFSAIADSNITTLISAAILFAISGGLVKGFAVTLVIGIISSMIGALIVTRVVFMWIVDKGLLTKVSSRKLIPDGVFDILSKAPTFIIASLVVTAISFATLAFKGKESLGIDFRGGALVHVELNDGKKLSEPEIHTLLNEQKMPNGKGIGSFYIQEKTAQFGQVWGIRGEFEAGATIEQAINAKWGKDLIKGIRTERVGSVIGSEMAKTSLIALAAALLAIFVYLLFRFEAAFAIGAIVALFHDVLMVPGLCVLFGQELSIIHVGALLTIAGYSINDTIVVFDRIREVIHSGRSGAMRTLMNEAICMTLSRTLLTGPTALAPMIVLLFMGNPAMIEFAMPIVIGVLLGTYSSIFIASPLVLWYTQRTGVALEDQIKSAHEEKLRMEAQIKSAQAQA